MRCATWEQLDGLLPPAHESLTHLELLCLLPADVHPGKRTIFGRVLPIVNRGVNVASGRKPGRLQHRFELQGLLILFQSETVHIHGSKHHHKLATISLREMHMRHRVLKLTLQHLPFLDVSLAPESQSSASNEVASFLI